MKPQTVKSITIVGTVVGVLIIAGFAGYRYLRNSDWWVSFTLFNDETRVDNFKNFHELFPSEMIKNGNDVWEFDRMTQELPDTYVFDGEERLLAEFLEKTWTTGFVVAVDETIVFEDYFRDYRNDSLPTSFSMAKSVLSVLVGIAIDQGFIESVHDRVDQYLTSFVGTDYGAVSIQDLLTMSSGLGFDENYDSYTSDITLLPIRVFGFREALPDLLVETEAVGEPGLYNRYVSSDSIVLGLVVQEATGMSLGQFLEENIWIPAGMENPAYWNTDFHGNALGHAFLSATLTDYLRFGQLVLNDGRRDDRQLIPPECIFESVVRSEERLQPGPNPHSDWTFGYGYQWWIPEEPQGDFAAIGIWGQYIYVHPEYRVVIVKTSADAGYDERDHESIAVFRTIAEWASPAK
jgi:CubicO group peptidase (beta-lactamase class C family)